MLQLFLGLLSKIKRKIKLRIGVEFFQVAVLHMLK